MPGFESLFHNFFPFIDFDLLENSRLLVKISTQQNKINDHILYS